jgi:hypothetical protein
VLICNTVIQYVSCKKCQKQGVHKFSKNLKSHLKISGARRGPTNMRHHHTKCNHLGDKALGTCEPLVKSFPNYITCQQRPVKNNIWKTRKFSNCRFSVLYEKIQKLVFFMNKAWFTSEPHKSQAPGHPSN